MNAPRMRDFIEQLPACMQAESLADLAAQFSHSNQRGQVVILDAFQRPMGIANAQRWLVYLSDLNQSKNQSSQHIDYSSLHLLSHDSQRYSVEESLHEKIGKIASPLEISFDQPATASDRSVQADDLYAPSISITPQTPISDFIYSIYNSTGQLMLDPVAIASDQWTLEEFHYHLHQQNLNFSYCPLRSKPKSYESSQEEALYRLSRLFATHQIVQTQVFQWVVVDECDRYLGTVHFSQLWQALMPQPLAQSSSQLKSQELKAQEPPQFSQPQPLHSSASAAARRQFESSLSQLLHSLDLLPLPLMVQSTDGTALAYNSIWQQQIAGLADTDRLWRQVAQVLEQSFASKSREGAEPSGVSGVSGAIATPSSVSAGIDSCMCTCTLKNGQERVWQFHKIAIDLTSPNAVASDSSVLEPASPDSWLHPLSDAHASTFRLAPPGNSFESSSQSKGRSPQPSEPLWLIYVQDITEQRQALKELAARNADLAQTSRLKDEFLACITHELKTPLTSILGLSGLMKDQGIGSLSDRQLRYMQLIHNSGRRLVLIVNDILDLTRIETGQIQLNSAPTLIHRACKYAYEEARQAHLFAQSSESLPLEKTPDTTAHLPKLPTFHLDIQPGLKQVIADELRLRQILSHLLSNALKFTPAEGDIGLRVSLWENWITFTVWDTGIGIPTDKQHLIFQKFQQLENPMTRQFEGTGLGLVLAQKLAQLHGGDMTFTSTEGEGSQFTLLLPPRPLQPQEAWTMNTCSMLPAMSASTGGASDESSAASHEMSQMPLNRLVVIVEGDRQLIERLVKQVTAVGCRAVIARSGTEAIGKIRRLQPRMVLLNSVLPLLSGWDVLTLLKADALTRHIPIVVMASPLESAKATENQADGVLTHPIQSGEMRRTINRILKLNGTEPASDSLTLLYLNPEASIGASVGLHPPASTAVSATPGAIALNTQTLNSLLHPYRCRVIEVDDLEQAELLSRVWKPDVILLGEPFPQPETTIDELSQRLSLAELPLVTLSRVTTKAANRVHGLKVFPCLEPMQIPNDSEPAYGFGLSSLLQVIQIATGIQWVPHIVVTHSDYLLHPDIAQVYDPGYANQLIVDGRLQASSQYFQTAGLRSSVMTTFSEITQCVGQKNVDVLLLCCTTSQASLDSLLLKLEMLEQLDPLMPIVIWLDGNITPDPGSAEADNLSVIPTATDTTVNLDAYSNREMPLRQSYIEATLKSWASHVLPATIAIDEVFAAVNAALARRIHKRSGG